jgi:L-glyceraldehyde 3-phosphate reductase
MTYIAAENRYESIPYRRVGRSGLVLPALSLGLWHNFVCCAKTSSITATN